MAWLQRLVGILLILTAVAVALSRAPDRPVESLVARWAPPPSEFVDLKGQLVHLRDEGPRTDPVPVVLLHGTSASLHTWEGWAAALRGQRRVIRFDLPGFGLTGPFTGGFTPDDYRGDTYARFVLALLEARGVQRFVIGGNSLGGEIAWRVAAMAPERVDKLILVDASGHEMTPEDVPLGFRVARLPLLNRIGEYLLPRGLIEVSVQQVYGDPAKVTPALVDRYFELALREGNRRALGLRLQQLESGRDVARLQQLKLPTLILWGGRDRLIPPVYARRFHAEIAGSQLQVFDKLGHVPQEEDPAATVAPVKAFLGLPG